MEWKSYAVEIYTLTGGMLTKGLTVKLKHEIYNLFVVNLTWYIILILPSLQASPTSPALTIHDFLLELKTLVSLSCFHHLPSLLNISYLAWAIRNSTLFV